MTKRVAIQGIVGSYHDIAARNIFAPETISLVDCSTFRNVVSTVLSKPGMFGLIAIENTIAGSILPNHELIRESGLFVAGEHKLRISHCLAALPGTNMDDLQEIGSHPMALMQCQDFLDSLPPMIRIVEKEDTATSARQIAFNKTAGHAAICSSQAAQIYGLEVLAEAIETDPHNFTRFLLVTDLETAKKFFTDSNRRPNKASLVFALPHSVGSLSAVLTILSFYGVNLTKIQSFPRVGMAWQYYFYVDCTFSDHARYKQSLNAVLPLTNDLRILGEYETSE
jgi:prephenate dehydratase